MPRTVHLTVTLKLEVPLDASPEAFYDRLPHTLRTGLGTLLPAASDAVTVIAARDPGETLSRATSLGPLLSPQGEIAIVWSTDDVRSIRPDLSDDQAMEVLHLSESKHDANFGINWDTLAYAAEVLFGDAPEFAGEFIP